MASTPPALPPATRVFQGFLDGVNVSIAEGVTTGVAAGWAADRDSEGALEVELLIDGIESGRALADGYREDLAAAGFGTGHHAFVLPIPAVFMDGQPHRVEVRVAGTTHTMALDPLEKILGEPPPPPPRPVVELPAPKIQRAIELSVVMPTYNRGAVMEASVERYLRCAERVGAELVIIDDGSRDDTPDRLARLARTHANLVIDRVPNSGPARARNLAAAMARGRVLVFVGDDVMPVDDDFLSVHAAAHTKFSGVGQAVLGKISWPNASEMPVNYVMSHIQGEGEQQFGYRSMKAYQWYDWRLFYSSNISVKKAMVADWVADGYDSSFYLAAFEDPEFALRTTLRLAEAGERFGVFYAPSAHLVHYHPYTVAGFIARQVSVGMMAQRFLELHPSRETDLGLNDIKARLNASPDPAGFPVEHYFSVFEGLKSWALVIENHYGLGSQNWHADLLKTVFQLAYFEGFLRMQTGPNVNLAAGCRYVLEMVRREMNRAIATEVLGDLPGFGLV